MTTEHINSDNERTCYICFEAEQSHNNPLLRSPCNTCNMYVHQLCIDKHLIHDSIKEKCVLMTVDRDGVVSTQSAQSENNEQHIAYASCTICKTRFEYRSPLLIETLKGMNAYIRSMAAKQLSIERESSNNEEAISSEPEQSSANVNSVVMDVIHSFQQEMQLLHGESEVAQDTTNVHPVIYQLFHELLKYMTPEELAKELATSVQSIRYASYIVMGCATVLTGITLNMVFS